MANATYRNTIGATTLSAYWKDPAFNAAERAFYYVRVIQIPSPRCTAMGAAGPALRHRQRRDVLGHPAGRRVLEQGIASDRDPPFETGRRLPTGCGLKNVQGT